MPNTIDQVADPDRTEPGPAPADAAPPEPMSVGELLAPIKGKLALACALMGMAAAIGLVPFIAIAELARELLGDEPADDGRLWGIAIIAGASLAVRLLLTMAALSVTHFADNDLQLHLRRSMAERLGQLPLGWFDHHEAGEVKKLVVDDVGTMHHLVGHSFTDLSLAVVTPIAAVAYMFTIDWQMTLVVIVPFVVGAVLFSRQMVGYEDKMAEYNHALEEVNVGAVEFVQGISVVKTFGATGKAHGRFIDSAHALVDHFWNWVSGLIKGSAAAEVALSPLLTLAVISGVGALFVDNGWISGLDLVVFFLIGLALTAPVLTLGQTMNQFQLASEAAARVGGLLREPVLPEPEQPIIPVDDTVSFDDVEFSYDGERLVLEGIDLACVPGSVTALVGSSGSGKSTLAKLLCRFWDPTGGSVKIGGVDLRQIDSTELYRRVGFVFQDVQLVRATVGENIALGRPDASPEEIERAARLAQIHDRILELPNGYDTVVGAEAQFSGGEAQRVSIARALLADPPILVLDEATSFADPESEAAIQDALANLTVGRTLIVIAHRLSTVVEADTIVVLDNGRIVERGAHDELVAADAAYAAQWRADQRASRTAGEEALA